MFLSLFRTGVRAGRVFFFLTRWTLSVRTKQGCVPVHNIEGSVQSQSSRGPAYAVCSQSPRWIFEARTGITPVSLAVPWRTALRKVSFDLFGQSYQINFVLRDGINISVNGVRHVPLGTRLRSRRHLLFQDTNSELARPSSRHTLRERIPFSKLLGCLPLTHKIILGISASSSSSKTIMMQYQGIPR